MKTVTRTKSFSMEVPAEELFPLFSPEGEKSWVPGWEYTNVMGSAELAEDYVFLTESHDHKSNNAIWIVKRYEPDVYLVQFYKVEPDEKLGVVTVRCDPTPSGGTRVEVTYKYSGLSPSGDEFVSQFSESVYDSFIGEWKELLTNYFAALG